jgi:hypothetical protein
MNAVKAISNGLLNGDATLEDDLLVVQQRLDGMSHSTCPSCREFEERRHALVLALRRLADEYSTPEKETD